MKDNLIRGIFGGAVVMILLMLIGAVAEALNDSVQTAEFPGVAAPMIAMSTGLMAMVRGVSFRAVRRLKPNVCIGVGIGLSSYMWLLSNDGADILNLPIFLIVTLYFVFAIGVAVILTWRWNESQTKREQDP